MTSDTKRKLDMLKRVRRFIVEYPVPSTIPRATAAHAEVVATIASLEAAAQNQVGGTSESEGGVDLRSSTARDLREYLKNVNRTARILEADHPGISPIFRLPKSGSYPALIVRARAIIETAIPIQASFIDAGLPATFLDELRALLDAFEIATRQKHDGRIAQVINTAALKASADRGVTAATILDACMRNLFRNNPEMLAAWIHARRIERAPRRASREKESTPVAARHRQPDSTITRETISLRQNSPALSDRDPLVLFNVTLGDDPSNVAHKDVARELAAMRDAS